MSFHPDILSIESFTPHPYKELVEKRAFPEGAIPEKAYEKMLSDYDAASDVDVRRVTYRHDGLVVNGLMATPNDPPKEELDLVIFNRGGSGNYGMLALHLVLRNFVALARAGYVVIGSNYRGNDGGEGMDEFGGRDVDDIIALHDIVRQHPLVNDLPCFVSGHSRGGMMTYLLIKRGLPIRAAIATAAVADLRGGAEFRSEMRENVYKRYIPDFEANEEALLNERSAICWPEKLDVPLLLFHGTSDEAVPHEQSEQLAEKLNDLGHPHELVIYEKGNHALSRFKDDILKRSLEWMERYAA